MSSPFSNPKEFLEAEGPIYTFGNNPSIITFLLIVSSILFLWFIYASYKIKSGKPPAKNPVALSLLIAASALSLAGTAYNSVDKIHQPARRESRVISSKKQQWQLPMTLIGMVASGSLLQRRTKNRQRKRIKTTNRNQHEL
jgi:cation transport ATPase